jgi:hypothetical protein
MPEAREDANLADVKAVLRKIQRLDFPSAVEKGLPDQVASILPKSAPIAAPAAGIGVFDRKHAAIVRVAPPKAKATKRLPGYLLVLIGGALVAMTAAAVLVATGIVKIHGDATLAALVSPGAPIPAAPQKGDEDAVLTQARRLLSEGDVAAARVTLGRAAPEERAEVAFVLAQAFDPNYLRTLPKANAVSNPAEAERWYRKWYELAVNSGLEMDGGRLNRIINAMH